MQAAFVDIGLEKAAFLHASDVASGAPAAVGDD
jgi:Ribonuclease G/E